MPYVVWWRGRGNETAAAILLCGLVGFVVSLLFGLGGWRPGIGLGLIVAAVINYRVVQGDAGDSALYSIPLPAWTYILGVIGVLMFVGSRFGL